MNEDNNNQNDQPTEEQKPFDETEPKLREISDEELEQILEDHKKWLESDGKEGERADLIGTDLQKAFLSGADLQKAFLINANLQNANLTSSYLQKALLESANLQNAEFSEANLKEARLSGANMQKAKFVGANLQKAILNRANLQKAYLVGANLQGAFLKKADMRNTVLDGVKGLSGADLQYANLEGATGLLGNEFAQADVTGTNLPDDLKDFKALETVKETSQNARKIFFSMLLGCVYSWLTIATTTDVRLLTNTASSPLPIIGTEIPIAGFYWAAPFVIMCLYFYFHLYLLKLWESLGSLPAVFPDGKRLDERAYPWFLNGLVRDFFRLLKPNRPIIARIQQWITIFLALYVVPFTMICFWLRYIPRHDWFGTCFHIGLIVISFAFAIIFYRLCTSTLRGKKKTDFRILNFWKDRRFYYGVSVIIVGIIFSLYSYGAIEGVRSQKPYFSDIKILVPWASEKLGYGVFADFREKRVTEIPSNYGEIAKEERLEFVKGANLKGRNLKYVDMSDAFMVKADLRGALLNSATLQNANLKAAKLSKANLKAVNLSGANLQQADLSKTNLQEANLEGAILKEANLVDAKLQQANIRGAKLQQADLENAQLQQANLGIANLQQAQLLRANLQGANLWKANLQQAYLAQANLKAANLSGANLQQADLLGTNLQEAYFNDADLKNANLSRADLRMAKNLTIEQLSQIKTLYNARLDPELMEQIKKCCPHLLKKPKMETYKKDETK